MQAPRLVAAQYSLVFATTIRTFSAHQLREYESGLTHPLMVNGWHAGEELEFIYRLGEKPDSPFHDLPALAFRDTLAGLHLACRKQY